MTVPDHRIDEMMQELRQLKEQNSRLRGTVDALVQRPTHATPEPQEDSPFTPEVESALSKRFEREMAKRFAPMEQQNRQAIGNLADQNDHLRFALTYGQDTYGKYQDKIERIRAERAQQGQWVSREDAYKHVFFEENGRKPATNPAPAARTPEVPTIDPYTGMLKEPEATATLAPEAQPAQAQPVQQVQPAQQVVKQEQTQLPALPMQTAPPVTAQPATQTSIPRNLTMEMDSSSLGAWADKFGDIPL